MARLNWSEPALQDLEQIADYISLDDDAAAKRLVKKVFKQAELLELFPDMGSAPEELFNSAYLHFFVKPLRIFYRVQEDDIFIVYVMRQDRPLRLEEVEEHDNT